MIAHSIPMIIIYSGQSMHRPAPPGAALPPPGHHLAPLATALPHENFPANFQHFYQLKFVKKIGENIEFFSHMNRKI